MEVEVTLEFYSGVLKLCAAILEGFDCFLSEHSQMSNLEKIRIN